MAIKTKQELFDRLLALIRSRGVGGKTQATDVRAFMVDHIDTMYSLLGKLYNGLGAATDGSMTQKAVTDALATKAPLVGGKVPSQYLNLPTVLTTDYHPLRFNAEEIAGEESEPGFISKTLQIPDGHPSPAADTRIEFANRYGVFFSDKVLVPGKRNWPVTYPTDSGFVTIHYHSTVVVGQPDGNGGEPVIGTPSLVPFFGADQHLTEHDSFKYTEATGLEAPAASVGALRVAGLEVTDSITRIAKYSDHERGKRFTAERGAWNGRQIKHPNMGPEIFRLGDELYFGGRQSQGIYVYNTLTRTGRWIDHEDGPANGIKLIPDGFPMGTNNFNEVNVFGIAVTPTEVWSSLYRGAGADGGNGNMLTHSLWLWDKVNDIGIDVLATATGVKPPGFGTGAWNLVLVGDVVYLAHHYGLVEYNHTTKVCRMFASVGGSPINGDLPPAGHCVAVHHKDGKVYSVFSPSSAGYGGLGFYVIDLVTNTGKRYTTAGGVSSGQNLQTDDVSYITSSDDYIWVTTQSNGVFRLNPVTNEGYRYTTTAGVSSGLNFPSGWVQGACHYAGKMYFACVGGGGIQIIDLATNAGSRITTITPCAGEPLPFNAPQGVHVSELGLWATHRGLGIWERAVGPPEPFLDSHLSQLGHTKGLIDQKFREAASAAGTGPVTDERILETPMTGYTELAVDAESRSASDPLLQLVSKHGTVIRQLEQRRASLPTVITATGYSAWADAETLLTIEVPLDSILSFEVRAQAWGDPREGNPAGTDSIALFGHGAFRKYAYSAQPQALGYLTMDHRRVGLAEPVFAMVASGPFEVSLVFLGVEGLYLALSATVEYTIFTP